jgi:hypothetical protein
MTAGFMDNLKKLLCLTGELTEKKNKSQIQLAETEEKKKKVQQYLNLVSHSLQSYSSDHKRKEKENETSLKELTSLLEAIKLEDDQAHLSELLFLLNGSTGQENLDHFRQKMDTFFNPMDEKITAASVSNGQLEKQKQITIKVELLDKENKSVGAFSIKPLTSWPKDTTAFTPHQRDSFLLSHLVFELQSRMIGTKSPLSPLATPFSSTLTSTITNLYENPSSPTNNPLVARSLTQVHPIHPQLTATMSPNIWQVFPNRFAHKMTQIEQPFSVPSDNRQTILVNTQSILASKRFLSQMPASPSSNPALTPSAKNQLNYRLELEVWNHLKEPFGSFVIIPPPSSHYMAFIKKLTEICYAHPGGFLNRNSTTISKVLTGSLFLFYYISKH